jgi:3D (Asp-Asp-Asp) domain-containing protein
VAFNAWWLILAGLLSQPQAARSAPRPNAVLEMEITAYCTSGETASGQQTRRGLVAADPRVLPLGSRVRVDGLGRPHDRIYDVADTGREIKGRELDIFMPDCRTAKAFGRRIARVRILDLGKRPSDRRRSDSASMSAPLTRRDRTAARGTERGLPRSRPPVP